MYHGGMHRRTRFSDIVISGRGQQKIELDVIRKNVKCDQAVLHVGYLPGHISHPLVDILRDNQVSIVWWDILTNGNMIDLVINKVDFMFTDSASPVRVQLVKEKLKEELDQFWEIASYKMVRHVECIPTR